MKVALFFAWFLGFAIGLPALVLPVLKQGGEPAFVVDSQAAAIVMLDNGQARPAPAYSYSFDLNDLKQPIVALITGNGWDYRPVITFRRPLGG